MKRIVFILGLLLCLAPVSAQAWMVGGYGNWATVGMQITNDISGYLGYSGYTYGGGAAAENDYLVKADYNLWKLRDVQTKVGLDYRAWTYSYSGANSNLIDLTVGASVMITKNLSVGGDVILASLGHSEYSGALTYILPGTFMSIQLYF